MMKSRVLIFVVGYFLIGCHENDFKNKDHFDDHETKEGISIIYNLDSLTSDRVHFSIQANEEYLEGESIDILLIWKNPSDSTQKINIIEYWDHPVGVGALITDDEGNELVEYSSNHILSSRLFLKGELDEGIIVLEKNEVKRYEVDLMKIPTFKNDKINQTKILPRGKYKIQLFYHQKPSNKLEIEIK